MLSRPLCSRLNNQTSKWQRPLQAPRTTTRNAPFVTSCSRSPNSCPAHTSCVATASCPGSPPTRRRSAPYAGAPSRTPSGLRKPARDGRRWWTPCPRTWPWRRWWTARACWARTTSAEAASSRRPCPSACTAGTRCAPPAPWHTAT